MHTKTATRIKTPTFPSGPAVRFLSMPTTVVASPTGARATTTAPSPTSARPSDSIRRTRSPTLREVRRTITSRITTAPSFDFDQAIKLDPKYALAHKYRGDWYVAK